MSSPDATDATDATIAAFFHRSLTLRAAGRRLSVDVSQELFSSNKIDTGTLALIKFVERTGIGGVGSVLDLGTGYGPIALAASAMFDSADVTAVDRDALAVAYAEHNARKNGLQMRARGSLGYDQLGDERFDLILSNVPGHAGPRLPESLLTSAADHLAEDGTVVVVIVNPLADLLDDLAARSVLTIVEREQRSTHSVVRFQPNDSRGEAAPAFSSGVYDRGDATFRGRDFSYSLPTVHGLPEFDSLGFATDLTLGCLDRVTRSDSAIVWNPGQGHVPLALARRFRGIDLTVVDRDLLALLATRRAVLTMRSDDQVALCHEASPAQSLLPAVDLSVAMLRRKEPRAAQEFGVAALEAATGSGGYLAVAGASVLVDRVVAALGLAGRHKVAASERRRGFAASLFQVT